MPAPATIPLKKLDRKSATWDMFHHSWNQIDWMAQGGIVLKNHAPEFLAMRPKEVQDVYQQRVQRFVYQDILGNCVGWYVAKLFQAAPEIDAGDPDKTAVEGFMRNCDMGGTTFVDFFQKVFQYQLQFGAAYVLVDKKAEPKDAAAVVTLYDQKAMGLDKPYLVLYDPRSIINCDTDEYGNITWAVIRYEEVVQPDPFQDAFIRHVWLIFDATSFYKYAFDEDPIKDISPSSQFFDIYGNYNQSLTGNEAAKLVDQGSHSMAAANRVPLLCMKLPDTLWLANRALLHLLEHVDLSNTYSWKLFITNLAQLVVKGEENMANATLSEVGFIHLQDPKSDIFFLEPEAGTFEENRARLGEIREETYRDFYLQAQARTASATAHAESGYSKEMDMAPAKDILASFGNVIRAAMVRVLEARQVATGTKTPKPVEVKGYEFETQPALQDLNTMQAAIDSGVTDKSETLEKELDKRLADKLLNDADESTKSKIASEIEAAPTRKEARDAEQQAQLQSFQTSFQRKTSRDVIGSESAAA